jgi:hypothetical protein
MKRYTMAETLGRSRAAAVGERRRWYVHLALLVTLAGSLATLVSLSHSITIHVIVGVAFVGCVAIHLYQRRRTVTSLAKQWMTITGRSRGPSRVAISDTILELLVANVVLSGIVDALGHQATTVPLLVTLGLPSGLDQWHRLAGIVLVVYVIVHVSRRRRRLRHSRIH